MQMCDETNLLKPLFQIQANSEKLIASFHPRWPFVAIFICSNLFRIKQNKFKNA